MATNNDSKQSNTVRWGIIGCGAVTEVKSGPAYQGTPGFEIRAVMRRDPQKAADYALRHGIPKFYTDADALITDKEIDAVYIATPPDSHLYYALKVAEAGKPCCIEKPLAPNYTQSLAIYNAFKEKGIPLFTAYYRRSLPRFLKVKEWIVTGKIGKVRHIRWHLRKPPSQLDLSGAYNWRTDVEIAPGGYFDDLACHGLDLFVYFLGEIEMASGVSVNQQGLYTTKDAIAGCWRHKNGVTGEGSWNFGCSDRKDKVEILGSEGHIQFSVFNDEDIVLWRDGELTRLFIENPKHIQKPHVENIRAHLFENQQHPSTGETAAHTNWVMDRILNIER